MKRIFTLLFSLIMILSLSACSSYDLSGLSDHEKVAVQNVATLKNKVNSDSFDMPTGYVMVGKKTDDDNFYITLISYNDANKESDLAIFKNNKFLMNYSETKNLDGNAQADTELQEILLFVASAGFSKAPQRDGYDIELISTDIIKERLNLK